MISETLSFLKDQLNNFLSAGQSDNESHEDPVVFVDGEKMDPLSFRLGALSLLLINIEEEKLLRPPDRYRRTAADGTHYQVHPPLHLNLYILVVARFKQYEEALRRLALVIQYFQTHRLFGHPETPTLPEQIEQVVIELLTLPFAEQNEVWSSLRLAYHPSVLYKVKMVIYQDEAGLRMTDVKERVLQTASMDSFSTTRG
ncbi:MAG: DUF4255 domain-containing protein [Caldilineaceae bacterium]